MLDANVNMNMNFSYPTTMYEIILTQMYIFLVLFSIFALYHEKRIRKNCKTYFSTRVVHVHVNVFL